ncbi:dna polymerase beta [Plasmopara halstedii]|uniref:Dna polymerase beta n=1 Tax=Plasmopara halstedii TaxID=4781 RepID=A0A0P1B7X7_PLAHL|nr:dna polymerase beta [Plasmopara halstedii]CEG50244.1 dna polymerase beta [Plasmopara halstedii]|eukprot:XP_024586613.1 dna polymerase beta [Plasmopara halstedii]
MSSREASKKAAKELLALCAKEGVKLPTDPVNAAVEAGTMINATRENNEFQLDAALKEMIRKFGVKESASDTKKSKRDVKTEKKIGRKRKSTTDKEIDESVDEDEKTVKKPRKKIEAACEANQALADVFAELSGFEFKRGERFKGGTWSKVAKAIRDCESELKCGKDALKLKGVGKSSAAMVDEYIETA